MTKAERIYKETRYRTVKSIEAWDFNLATNGGWAGGWITVTDENPDGEIIFARTQNALLRLLEADKEDLYRRFDHEYAWDSKDKRIFDTKVLLMMERTAANTRIHNRRGSLQ